MNERSGPTPEDVAEYGRISDDDPTAQIAFDTEVSYARVELTYEQTCALVAAGELVGENPIAFMRNAALSRAAEILSAESEPAAAPAAGS